MCTVNHAWLRFYFESRTCSDAWWNTTTNLNMFWPRDYKLFFCYWSWYFVAYQSGNWGQYFTFGVPSPLDDERRGSTVTLSFPRHCKIENRLNHGRNLKMMNLREQTSHDSEKTENMLIRRAVRRSKNKFAEIALVFPYNAKTFSSIMGIGATQPEPCRSNTAIPTC